MVRRVFAYLFAGVFIFYAFVNAQEPAAPDFKLKDISGNEVTLGDFKGKSAVLLLFWATWCPYCKNELKELDSMSRALEVEGLKVLAVDVGEPQKTVSSFIGKRGLKDLTVLLDENMAVTDLYGIIGVPFYLLIDKEGRIRFSNSYFPQKEYKQLIAQQ